jgi:hypothetical protein
VEPKVEKGKWKERNKAEEREEIRKRRKKTHPGNAPNDTNKQRIPSCILSSIFCLYIAFKQEDEKQPVLVGFIKRGGDCIYFI